MGRPAEEASGRLGPAWVSALLQCSFFAPCRTPSHKGDTNWFCLDCGQALCPQCVALKHTSHRTLQVRRSSYHDALRVVDIQKMVDLSEMQLYTINSARIVFIHGRPPPRPVNAEYPCEICDRPLLDPGRFCALECKARAAARDVSVSLTPQAGHVADWSDDRLVRVSRKVGKEGGGEKVKKVKSPKHAGGGKPRVADYDLALSRVLAGMGQVGGVKRKAGGGEHSGDSLPALESPSHRRRRRGVDSENESEGDSEKSSSVYHRSVPVVKVTKPGALTQRVSAYRVEGGSFPFRTGGGLSWSPAGGPSCTGQEKGYPIEHPSGRKGGRTGGLLYISVCTGVET